MAENAAGDVRYLMPDGLGSIRQAVDEDATVVSYKEFDPYGNLIVNLKSEIVNRYGFTGEWWEDEVALLHLRARWYAPGVGIFLSRDPVEGEPPYLYVRGNPVNLTDPIGLFPPQPPTPGWPYFFGEPIGFQLLVSTARKIYSRNGITNCADTPDDGQHPSDGIPEIWIDFICEYGPNPRHFYGNDLLTQELAASHIMSVLRDEFYASPPYEKGIEGPKGFGFDAFVMATQNWAETGKVGLVPQNITHFLGGFSYKIHKSGNIVRFYVTNNTTRASGTRLRPGSGAGGSIEEALIRGESAYQIRQKIASGDIVSILRPQRREQTDDLAGVGGGNFEQIFEWYELFDECTPLRDHRFRVPGFSPPSVPIPLQQS